MPSPERTTQIGPGGRRVPSGRLVAEAKASGVLVITAVARRCGRRVTRWSPIVARRAARGLLTAIRLAAA
jgi:hypothetical protein